MTTCGVGNNLVDALYIRSLVIFTIKYFERGFKIISVSKLILENVKNHQGIETSLANSTCTYKITLLSYIYIWYYMHAMNSTTLKGKHIIWLLASCMVALYKLIYINESD